MTDLHPDEHQDFVHSKGDLNAMSLYVLLFLGVPLALYWIWRILCDDATPPSDSGAGKRRGSTLIEAGICTAVVFLAMITTIWIILLVHERNVLAHLGKESVRWASTRPNVQASEVIAFVSQHANGWLDVNKLSIGVTVTPPTTIRTDKDASPRDGVVHVDLVYDAGSGITLRSSAESVIPFGWTTGPVVTRPPTWP